MKKVSFFIALSFIICCFVWRNLPAYFASAALPSSSTFPENMATLNVSRLEEASRFCKSGNMDTSIAFFVDMSIHSGKQRFFIVDLNKRKILHSSLCCHGMGKGSTAAVPVFSNENGSNCTSLGKYKTGKRAYSKWGVHVHYKMHGLENTNKKAFQRTVVLHSYDPVVESDIYPQHLPLGWSLGCPVISNKLMTTIDELLKVREKPVLIWIYH